MYVLGFDPGGQKQFGWCVTEISQVEGLNLVDSGTASDSASAITAATKYVTDGNQIASVGIDSPHVLDPRRYSSCGCYYQIGNDATRRATWRRNSPTCELLERSLPGSRNTDRSRTTSNVPLNSDHGDTSEGSSLVDKNR
jgi:hypothetical protein